MTIQLTDIAKEKAQELNENNLPLRLYLAGKGCDGFYYGVSFDSANGDDMHFQQGGVEIIVDPATLEFVSDSTIDWVSDERGTGFLVSNPKHRQYRGKFYKRPKWQSRLVAGKIIPSSP